MALAATTPLASYDQSAGEFLDLSNELAEIIRRDNVSFLSRVGISGEAIETTHSWMEDSLNANSATSLATADGVIDASATTLIVASGQGVRFRIGTLFKDKAAGKTEVIQVTAVSTDTLTIVRGYGSTTGETHGTGTTAFEIQIISHTNQEGQDPNADTSKVRTKVSNIVQIFQYGINISATMRAVMQAGVADEFTFQVARRLMEAMRELDSTLVAGIKSASAGSDSVYRSMGGIIEFASQSGGNVTTTTESLTLSVVNNMCKDIWDDGGVPNFLLVGGKQKRAVSAFDQSARRSVYDTNVAGYVVDRVITDLGFILDVIVDPWVPDDVAVVGDLNKVRVMPLRNSAMRAEDLAKTGSASKAQIYGEYTAEFRNAKEAFAYHNNLS
jgi:hypothetical protein